MKAISLLLLVVAAIVVAYPVATSAQVAWYPIGDINDPHIQELARWAVEEHVKKENDGLKFSKVKSGEEQSDTGGVKYHLIIEALNEDGMQGRFEVFLAKEVRSNRRTLISFSPGI